MYRASLRPSSSTFARGKQATSDVRRQRSRVTITSADTGQARGCAAKKSQNANAAHTFASLQYSITVCNIYTVVGTIILVLSQHSGCLQELWGATEYRTQHARCRAQLLTRCRRQARAWRHEVVERGAKRTTVSPATRRERRCGPLVRLSHAPHDAPSRDALRPGGSAQLLSAAQSASRVAR